MQYLILCLVLIVTAGGGGYLVGRARARSDDGYTRRAIAERDKAQSALHTVRATLTPIANDPSTPAALAVAVHDARQVADRALTEGSR